MHKSKSIGGKMKQTLDLHDFINKFKNVRADNFSYEGLTALYGYLTELEEDTGQEFEFDPNRVVL